MKIIRILIILLCICLGVGAVVAYKQHRNEIEVEGSMPGMPAEPGEGEEGLPTPEL